MLLITFQEFANDFNVKKHIDRLLIAQRSLSFVGVKEISGKGNYHSHFIVLPSDEVDFCLKLENKKKYYKNMDIKCLNTTADKERAIRYLFKDPYEIVTYNLLDFGKYYLDLVISEINKFTSNIVYYRIPKDSLALASVNLKEYYKKYIILDKIINDA